MLKVLLVDDEPVILEGLKVMIDWEQEGLQVVGSATDGMEAFRMIRELSPDIVITDIKMPRMSGLELLERVREKGDKQTGFIVLTGFDDFSYQSNSQIAFCYFLRGKDVFLYLIPSFECVTHKDYSFS